MERRDPVWRWAGTVDLHGRHGDPDFLFVHLFLMNKLLIFNRQSSSVSKCKKFHNCLNKTDYWGGKIWIFILWPSCDYFNKSNNNIIIVIIRIIYIYIYRSVALGLVLLAEFGPRRKLIEEPCHRRTFLSKWFHKDPLTSEEPFCFTKGSLWWKEGSSDYKKLRKRWFFKEPLTEWFFVEPKMVLLWHHLKNFLKHLYF